MLNKTKSNHLIKPYLINKNNSINLINPYINYNKRYLINNIKLKDYKIKYNKIITILLYLKIKIRNYLHNYKLLLKNSLHSLIDSSSPKSLIGKILKGNNNKLTLSMLFVNPIKNKLFNP